MLIINVSQIIETLGKEILILTNSAELKGYTLINYVVCSAYHDVIDFDHKALLYRYTSYLTPNNMKVPLRP